MIDKIKNSDYFAKKYHTLAEENFDTDRVLTIPNILTLSRLLALPFLLYYLSYIDEFGPWSAIAIGAFMVLTDMFDGFLAKTLHQITIFGAIMDPVIDKIIINGVAIVLAFNGYIPLWAVLLIFIRDMLILIFGLKIFINYESLATPAILGRCTPLFWICAFTVSLLNYPVLTKVLIGISFALSIVSGLIYLLRYRNLVKTKSEEECANSQ
jgi:CDP-diacylglycerol--glycerol-3-phosphate 3-phosphatidyltransferase